MVGTELLSQLASAGSVVGCPGVEKSASALPVDMKVTALARSDTMILSYDGIDVSKPQEDLWAGEAERPRPDRARQAALDLDELTNHLVDDYNGNLVVIDVTASQAVSDYYERWLAAGMHVITANKKAGSGDLKRFRACKKAMADTGAMWGDETTVGAGLPILNVLRTDLVGTGDKVKTIEGIFSGTLSYIFNTYKPGMKFSDVITDAKEKGFTEPDPRDDLNGMDVARKVTILARACGLEVELDAVPIESLVPAALEDWAPEPGEPLADAFVAQMAAFDAEKEALINEADAAGEVLRFVGRVDLDAKKVSVELRKYPKTHPFAGTQFADNICAFSTERYAPQPLVVQGPGAGAAVTAAGIFADVIKVAQAC